MAHEEEELVDYEDEIQDEVAAPAAATSGTKPAAGEDKKGSYVGIHSTGFR
jgi:ATP-dependent RNA helicase UAP56/SUB2